MKQTSWEVTKEIFSELLENFIWVAIAILGAVSLIHAIVTDEPVDEKKKSNYGCNYLPEDCAPNYDDYEPSTF